jgi:hypothetical protein
MYGKIYSSAMKLEPAQSPETLVERLHSVTVVKTLDLTISITDFVVCTFLVHMKQLL